MISQLLPLDNLSVGLLEVTVTLEVHRALYRIFLGHLLVSLFHPGLPPLLDKGWSLCPWIVYWGAHGTLESHLLNKAQIKILVPLSVCLSTWYSPDN